MRNTIIYLLGFPGTGKYTVAKALAKKEDFRLLDNHLVNNVLFSLIHVDSMTKLSDRVWDNIEKIWQIVCDTLTHISPPDYNFVLTNALFEGHADDLVWFDRVVKMAQDRQALFVPVRLICAIEEHGKRIVAPERSAKFKVIDPSLPLRFAQNDEVLRPSHPNTLTLDITQFSPEEAADKILAHVALCR